MTILPVETDLPDLRIVHGLAERQDFRGSGGDFGRRNEPADSKKFRKQSQFFSDLKSFRFRTLSRILAALRSANKANSSECMIAAKILSRGER